MINTSLSPQKVNLDAELTIKTMQTIVPNPDGIATDDLVKLKINKKIYKVHDEDVGDWARVQDNPSYTKNESNNLLGNKVDKVTGKGLSENDFTNTLKNKLDGIESEAQVNVQSDFAQSNNEADDFIKNKPTNLSDFANDQGFIDNTVNDLVNYYKKSEAYTKEEVNQLIGAISTITIEVVQALPTTNIKTNVIYLVPKNPAQTDNLYDEYVNTTGTSLGWEKIGDTEIDLSNYYTKTQTDSLLGNKVDKVEGKGLSTNDYDDTAKGIVNGVTSALADKVDKVEGYSLSKNDYTDADKALVGTITDKLDKTENAIRSDALAFVPVTDTAPYIYRQTPVKESFKALMHKIVGASVVWNQLVDSNTTSVTIASGHRYIAKINGTLTFGTSDGTAITVSENDYFTDLTAMFGTTIADYVYTLETAETGSGIAWLQSYGFFIEEYYAYQTNKIESGCVSGRKICGKNQMFYNMSEIKPINTGGSWDGNTYSRYGVSFTINPNDGTVYVKGTPTANVWLTFNDIPVKPFANTVRISGIYNIIGLVWNGIVLLDKNKNTITNIITSSNRADKTFNFSDYPETRYLKISIKRQTDGTAIDGTAKIQVEYDNVSTDYEPYASTTYPISPITLRGLFKLSTDKLTVNGDDYYADGSVTRNYGILRLGDLEWQSLEGGFFQTLSVSSQKLLCEKYIFNDDSLITGTSTCKARLGDKEITYRHGNIQDRIYIHDSTYEEADETTFTNAMRGIYLIYELKTPTTEQTIPFTETEIVGSTEEFIDYEVAQSNRDVAIPVGTDTDYYQEMKLPPLPTTSGNHYLQYNPANGFSWS